MVPMFSTRPKASGAQPRPWSLPERLAFRFAFCYWLLYFVPSYGAATLFDLIPNWGDRIDGVLAWPLAKTAHLVGIHVFYLLGEGSDWHPTGSGDTAMHYVLLLCVFALALAASAVWSLISEVRHTCTEYTTAYAFLRLFLRFSLAVTLLGYGFAKVFPGQFGAQPTLFQLNERWGESSPMHVLWMFMGASRPYTIFGGLAEVIPGALLLFRRTTTVGLLGSAAVMVNIVVLNFTYDVPVKIYSTHLLLLSLFLLLPDITPLWRFLVLRKPAELVGVPMPVANRRPLRIAAHVLQGLVVLACVWEGTGEYISRNTPWEHAPIYGVWQVASGSDFGSAAHAPSTFVMDEMGRLDAVLDDGKVRRYVVTYDKSARTVHFPKMERETALVWTIDGPAKLTLQGMWMGNPAKLTLVRTNPDDYLLQSRGFHWVQEVPYNR